MTSLGCYAKENKVKWVPTCTYNINIFDFILKSVILPRLGLLGKQFESFWQESRITLVKDLSAKSYG